MVKKLLVILGNGNDEEGNLSETAVLRARTAIAFLNHNSDYYVIPTGHFGDHFNNFHSVSTFVESSKTGTKTQIFPTFERIFRVK